MRNARVGMFAAVLAAALAICIVTAAVASALPALPELVNSNGEALVKAKFTSTSGKSTLETTSGTKVTCKADTDSGESTGVHTGTTTVKFTGCEAIGIKCSTTGAASGEIVTGAKSTLVWLNEAKEEAGQLLEAEEKTIKCSILSYKVKGSVLGAFSASGTSGTLTFKEKKGVQEPTEYEMEGKKFKAITETEGVQSGLETTDTLTFEEAVTLR